jgi:transposase InsO family protein
VERPAGRYFATRREAREEALEWIHWYNHRRMHSTLNYLSPAQFEKHWQSSEQRQGGGKVEKQKPLSDFPTATTATGL